MSGGEPSTVTLDDLVFKNVRLQGVFSRTAEYVRRSTALIERDPEPFDEIVSHAYAVEEAETAYRVADGLVPEAAPLKVVIDPSL